METKIDEGDALVLRAIEEAASLYRENAVLCDLARVAEDLAALDVEPAGLQHDLSFPLGTSLRHR